MQDDLDSEFEEVHELLEEDSEGENDRTRRSPDASSNRRNNRGRGRGNKGRNRGRNGNSQNVGNLNNDFSASMGMYSFNLSPSHSQKDIRSHNPQNFNQIKLVIVYL